MKIEVMSFKPRTIARLAFSLALSLAGCTNQPLPELTINSVSIYTDQDANQNSATAVDLVIIYDPNLVNSIGKMSASQYFSNAQQLILDNPTLLDIWHWELVPGQIVQAFTPAAGDTEAYAAYVFANYLTPGDHRLKVAPSGIINILLQKNDLLNISTENLVTANPGPTMTNAVKTLSSSQELQASAYFSCQPPCTAIAPPVSKAPCAAMIAPPTYYKAPCGTITAPPTYYKTPCDTMIAPSSSRSMSGSECRGQQILKRPIPITTRPLKIPPALRKNTPEPKVKNG